MFIVGAPCTAIAGEGRGHPELVCGFTRYQERVSQDAHSWIVTCVSGNPVFLAYEVGYIGRTVNQKRLAPGSSIFRVLQHYRWVSLGRCVSVNMSRGTARSREVRTLFLSSDVIAPHHRCSVADMAWDPLASVGRMRTIFGFWLVVQTAPTFIPHVSLRVYRKWVSMSTTYRVASGSADVLGYEMSPADAYCSGAGGKTDITYSLGGTDGLVARVASTVERWSSSMVTILFWRSAIVGLSQSLMQASRLRRRLMVSVEFWSTVRMEQRTFGGILCLLRSDWSPRWLDVCTEKECGRGEFVKDVGRWLRRWYGSQNGQCSRKAPGLWVPGHVSITPSR